MDSGLDQCEGTLVVHVDGGFLLECTDPECVDLDQLRHSLIVDCTALAGGCVCTVIDESAVFARVS
jgi:hypothetical protein